MAQEEAKGVTRNSMVEDECLSASVGAEDARQSKRDILATLELAQSLLEDGIT